jgi:hypothetical protein
MNDRRDAAKNIAGAMFAPTTLERDNPQSAIRNPQSAIRNYLRQDWRRKPTVDWRIFSRRASGELTEFRSI